MLRVGCCFLIGESGLLLILYWNFCIKLPLHLQIIQWPPISFVPSVVRSVFFVHLSPCPPKSLCTSLHLWLVVSFQYKTTWQLNDHFMPFKIVNLSTYSPGIRHCRESLVNFFFYQTGALPKCENPLLRTFMKAKRNWMVEHFLAKIVFAKMFNSALFFIHIYSNLLSNNIAEVLEKAILNCLITFISKGFCYYTLLFCFSLNCFQMNLVQFTNIK